MLYGFVNSTNAPEVSQLALLLTCVGICICRITLPQTNRTSYSHVRLLLMYMTELLTGVMREVINLGLDKEGTFCPTHQNLEGHLKIRGTIFLKKHLNCKVMEKTYITLISHAVPYLYRLHNIGWLEKWQFPGTPAGCATRQTAGQ